MYKIRLPIHTENLATGFYTVLSICKKRKKERWQISEERTKIIQQMKNYTIKEFRILKNSIHPEIRTFAKEAMTVDDLLYDLQGSISKKISKETKEIIVTIKEV